MEKKTEDGEEGWRRVEENGRFRKKSSTKEKQEDGWGMKSRIRKKK